MRSWRRPTFTLRAAASKTPTTTTRCCAREYPRSELQFEAHLLGLQAKLRKYQGENYDGTPLEEAKMLVKQLNSQFCGRLSKEEKDRLVHGRGAAEPGSRHARLPDGRLLRREERLRRGQALLRRR